MKKYILFAGLGCLAFYGFTFIFRSELPDNRASEYAGKGKVVVDSPREIASVHTEAGLESARNDSPDLAVANSSSLHEGVQAKNEEGPASTFPKYYNVKIKDKYTPAPKHVIEALARQEKMMKERTKKVQIEGDELVMCNSRMPKCVGGSNEAHNCITQQRNCDENSVPKKFTDLDLINVIGRNSFEKYRNHLEFVEKTGSSIRGPGSLEKY